MNTKKAVLFLFSLLLVSVSFAESVTFWKGYVFIGGQPATNGTVVEAFRNNATLVANYTIGTIDTSVSDRYGYYMIPVVVATIDGGHNVSFRINGVFPYTGANGSDASLQSVNKIVDNLLNISINKTANGGACRPYTGVTNATSYSHSGCSGGYCVHDLCRAASTYCGDSFCDTGESSSSCSADCGATTTTAAGGGGGVTTKVEETSTPVDISANTPKTLDITKTADLAVDEIVLTTKTATSSVSVTVKESSLPAAAPAPVATATGSVYKYVDITATNIQQSAISTAKVKFKVTRSWISDNKIDANTVKLNRYADNAWAKLSTTKVSEGTTDITYEAETPGFSTFAITGEKVVTTTTQPPANVTTTTEPTTVPATTTLPATTTTVPAKIDTTTMYLTIAGIVIILAAVAYFRLLGKKGRRHYIFMPEKKEGKVDKK